MPFSYRVLLRARGMAIRIKIFFGCGTAALR
jgi:hypothetical protein